MSEKYHKCIRCGYTTSHLVTFKRHLARKNICKNVISNNDLYEEYLKYDIKNKLEKHTKNPKNSKIGILNPSYSNYTSKNEYTCEYCNKVYSTNSNLNKHIKKCQKNINNSDNQDMMDLVKLLNDQLKEQRQEMKEQLEKRDKQIQEQNDQIKELIKKAGIINSNINIRQDIKLLSYGNTDVSHLTDNDYLKCLKHSNFCIPHLIEKIHFNPKKPENHNIYISNIKNNYVMLYDGNKWVLKNRDEVINELIDEKEIIIEQKLEEWIENGNQYPDIMKKFNRYIEKRENDKILNKIKDEIKLILFNNRKLIDFN